MKADGPEDLVFQSVRSGKPMRDNNILTRLIKPAARETRAGLGELAVPPNLSRDLAEDGRRRREGRSGPDAALSGKHHAGHLPAVRS